MRNVISQLLRALGLAAVIAASGCVVVDTSPINFVSNEPGAPSPAYIPDATDDGSTVLALSFSGGGTRAAAFAYGALSELDTLTIDEFPIKRTLVDNVRTVAGTSGGAVLAAYLGYRGKDDYRDFRERFLYQNAEASMATSVLPGTLVKVALRGGANDRNSFARWLDENLFDRATYSAFGKPGRPLVWVTASDIYNNTPFLFTEDTFAALCSDISQLKIAEAVGASAAIPVVFAPIILQAPKNNCDYHRPHWLERALNTDNPSIRLQAYARSLDSYQADQNLNFVRLLDGALTDNLGITGLTLELAKADRPYAPLSPQQAVRLRNFVFIVTDAGRSIPYKWGETQQAPHLGNIARAVSDTTIASANRSGFDAVDLALNQWQEALIHYRCGLPRGQVLKLRGTLVGWDCRDVSVTTEYLSFRDVDPDSFARLNKVPTRLNLARDEVDLAIEAGRQAVRNNPNIGKIAQETRKGALIFDAIEARQVPGQ
ncbi:patatin-like phospholipase family protein [Pseudaminobacter soli (ex Li et al. 2025)]|uniref:patatin-like phospholipase family protein n=1 Tax=Pseudaminobacter soli (ex Li et al. 2025) TaxID=1295366 RepID=UPI001FE0D6BC|nr:patatin-like phospholipase family protein [Mesorhizobium soli]